MQSKVTYELDREDLLKAISEMVEEQDKSVFDRFYNVFINAKDVAKIHAISPQTVVNYIKDGRIKPEPLSGRLYRFRLSEVLKMDFSKLKYKRQ
jgi:predicted DNA-binding transcriptional regulator AlpA